MNISITTCASLIRPHPNARGGLPTSTAGRRWIAVTVLAVPLLVVAVMVMPGLLLADRLPDEVTGKGIIKAAVWGVLTAVPFTLLVAQQRRRGRDAPAASWGWYVPLVYLFGGSLLGSQLFMLATNLDRTQRVESEWEGFVLYGSMILGAVAGALLARQVAAYLPRAAMPPTRAAWVETIPLGWPHLVPTAIAIVVMVAFLTWVDGSFLFALAAGMWVVAVYVWLASARVAVTPTGVRVTQGAFGLASRTRLLPIDDIAGAEVVRASVRDVVYAALGSDFSKGYAHRPGPALRVHLRSRRSVLISMRSEAHAVEAAALLAGWRATGPVHAGR